MSFSKPPRSRLLDVVAAKTTHGDPLLQWGGNCQSECSLEVKLEKPSRSCRRKRQGAAAVEFAVVAPLFFLLVIGMIEFGRAIMVQQVLTNAAREGARVGVLDSTTPTHDQVVSTVTSYLSSAGVSGATVTMSPNEPTSAGYGALVTVTVQIAYSKVSWLPAPWFLSGKTLSATAVMRRETVQ
jgi:Flp pilus assembly protein TadG